MDPFEFPLTFAHLNFTLPLNDATRDMKNTATDMTGTPMKVKSNPQMSLMGYEGWPFTLPLVLMLTL
jgi:hypothetical protein